MTLRISIKALFRNRMRSFLTMLGIIIGVATVIAMLAIGRGAGKAVSDSIASLGTNTLMVSPGSARQGGVRGGGGSITTLVPSDAEAIRRELRIVAAVTPIVRVSAQVVYQGQNWATSVQGVDVGFPDVRNWPMGQGEFFTPADVRSGLKVAVLGSSVVGELFAGADPIGETIRIKNVPFRVVGVLSTKGESAFGGNQDDTVLIPYTTAMRRLQRTPNINQIMVSVRNESDSPKASQQITALLRQRHRITGDEEDDFNVRSQAEIAQAGAASTRVLTLLLGGIASVSLLVGGIGIMNIMLVSVTERIREIGIRMAIGARGKDILLQFLVEAVLLSLVGGFLGVALGYGMARLMSGSFSWPLVVTGDSIALAFGFSAVIGVFFGMWPAVKASRLDPIQALRHE